MHAFSQQSAVGPMEATAKVWWCFAPYLACNSLSSLPVSGSRPSGSQMIFQMPGLCKHFIANLSTDALVRKKSSLSRWCLQRLSARMHNLLSFTWWMRSQWLCLGTGGIIFHLSRMQAMLTKFFCSHLCWQMGASTGSNLFLMPITEVPASLQQKFLDCRLLLSSYQTLAAMLWGGAMQQDWDRRSEVKVSKQFAQLHYAQPLTHSFEVAQECPSLNDALHISC